MPKRRLPGEYALQTTQSDLKFLIVWCSSLPDPCTLNRAYIRVFQLSSKVTVCPLGSMSIDAMEGKKLLNAAVNALFPIPLSGNSGSRDIDNSSENIEVKPCLVWSAFYMQELTKVQRLDSIRHTPMPDEHLDYDHLLDATEKVNKSCSQIRRLDI